MTVHLTWPVALAPIESLTVTDRHAVTVIEAASGRTVRRSFQDHPMRAYRLRARIPATDTATARTVQRILRELRGQLGSVWVREPVSEYHHDVYLGSGDGSRTTWCLRAVSPSDVRVYVAGAAASATVHAAANLLADDDASMEGSLGSITAVGTGASVARSHSYAAHGEYCAAVSVTSATTGYGLETGAVSVTAGRTYTAVARARGAGIQAVLKIVWYDSTPAEISTSDSSASTLSLGSWTALSVTGTAPAGAVTAAVRLVTAASSSETLYADALGLAPGDRAEWWLPSEAPALVELASAPASGAAVVARYTGRRCLPVRLVRAAGAARVLTAAGHTELTLDLVEVSP